MKDNNQKIFLCAGEASGDNLGAELAHDLLKRNPKLQLRGMGGDKMRAAGVDILFPYDEIAVIGLIEVFMQFRKIKQAYNIVKNELQQNKPDVIVLIDYPGFNLRIAKIAKQSGIRVIYYVSPKVWAWKKGRINTIKQYIDHMALLFAFEEKIYHDAGVNATFVGHPLAKTAQADASREEIFRALKLNPQNSVITLLPGSRKNEIKRMAPVLNDCVNEIHKHYPTTQFILPLAPSITEESLPLMLRNKVKITRDKLYNALSISTAAIVTSGTATLEVALMKVPMAIIYKTNLITYFVAKYVINIPYIGLCNIIAEQQVAPEYIQNEMTAQNICRYILKLMSDDAFHEQQSDALSKVKQQLSKENDTNNVADIVLNKL